MGATLPVYGFLFGEIIAILYQNDRAKAEKYLIFLTVAFAVVGSVSAFAKMGQVCQKMSSMMKSYTFSMSIFKIFFINYNEF